MIKCCEHFGGIVRLYYSLTLKTVLLITYIGFKGHHMLQPIGNVIDNIGPIVVLDRAINILAAQLEV